jgi:hypothetical protein
MCREWKITEFSYLHLDAVAEEGQWRDEEPIFHEMKKMRKAGINES